MMKTLVSASVQTGDTVANTTTKTRFATVLNMPPTASGTTVTAASDLRYGQSFDVHCMGIISTTATPGTLTMTVDHGNGSAGTTLTALGTTGAITPPASLSNAYWVLHGRVVYNTTGTDVGIATFVGHLDITKSDNTIVRYPLISTGSGTTGMTTGLDTTRNVYNVIGIAVQWQTAAAGNSITQAAGSLLGRRT